MFTRLLFLLIALLIQSSFLLEISSALKEGKTCVANRNDCAGLHHKRSVEPFAIAIPRICGTLFRKVEGKKVPVSAYTIVYTPVPLSLNKTHGDCGVYALKYIECHMLDLPLKLLDDENIKCARHKILLDLWEAAYDPVFIERMAMYEPPERDSDIIEIN